MHPYCIPNFRIPGIFAGVFYIRIVYFHTFLSARARGKVAAACYRYDVPVCAYHSSAPGVTRTSFRRFRRTILVGACLLPARRLSLEPGPRVRRHEGPCQGCRGMEKMLDALLRTQHNRLAGKSGSPSTVTWPHHETEEDRDAQDR